MPKKKKKSFIIQAVLFNKKIYTATKARAWLKSHNMKSIKKVDITDNHLRYRIVSPTKFNFFITKKTNKQISFILGKI